MFKATSNRSVRWTILWPTAFLLLGNLPILAHAETNEPNIYNTQIIPSGPINPNSGAPASWTAPIHDDRIYTYSSLDSLEYNANDNSPNSWDWSAQGWVGTDKNRMWWKTSGGGAIKGGGLNSASASLLYGRAITPFWNIQMGAKESFRPHPDRQYGVIGIEGLLPQWIDTEAYLNVSNKGKLSLDSEFEYDLLLTQKLKLAPSVGISASFQNDDKYGTGKGLNSLDLDLKLEYEVNRNFIPYVGIEHSHDYDEHQSGTALKVGISAWY